MAEFSRKSGRRILESIDTRKASKQEVFEFYKRFRNQKKRAGEKVPPLPKLKDISKKDIVNTLEKWEREPLEKKVEQQYKELVKKMGTVSPKQAAKEYEKFQKNLEFWKKQKMIDIKNILGGTLNKPFKAPEPEAPKPASSRKDMPFIPAADIPDIPESEPPEPDAGAAPGGSGSRPLPPPPPVTRYTGRLAHDLIAKWVDDGIIDNTDDYDDSEEIWEFMQDYEDKNEEYEFFDENYEGDEKTGTKGFYDEFKEFLQDCENFEADLRKKGEEIPPYGTPEYWEALRNWRDEQRNRF